MKKLVCSTLVALMLVSINAQELGKLRESIINNADNSAVADYLKAKENQSASHFFDILNDLVKLDELSKKENEKASAYRNIFDTFLNRVNERAIAGDLGSKLVLTTFKQKTGGASESEIQEMIKLADEGNPLAAFAALKMGNNKSFNILITPEKLKEYDDTAALGGIYEHLWYLSIRALDNSNIENCKKYIPLLEKIPAEDFSDTAKNAISRYATMLFKGDKIQQDKKEAVRYFEFLSDKNYYYSQVLLYLLYSESDEKDFLNSENAERIKDKALKNDAGKFYFEMANARDSGKSNYANAFPVRKDKKEAIELLEKSAALKDRSGTYFAGLRKLDPNSDLARWNVSKEAYQTASLEDQKKAIDFFEMCNFDVAKNHSVIPYAAIYLIGAPELRDISKGIEILERYSNRAQWSNQLPLLYAMATKGILMDKDEARAKKYESQAEAIFDNMNAFYLKVASIFNNDSCNVSPMFFYFIDEDSELGLQYSKLAFDKGNTDAAWRLLQEFTSKGEVDKAKEFLDKIDSEDAINLKLTYARDFKDSDYSFLVITDALKKGYPLRNSYELGNYFASSLSGKNKYITAAETEKILEDFEKNPPEWILEKYTSRTQNGVEYKESPLSNIFVWISRYLSGRYYSNDGQMMYNPNPQLAEKYSLKAIDLGSVEALASYTSFLLNEKKDIQNAIKYAKAYMEKTNDASDIFSRNRYAFIDELKRNPQPVVELFEYGAKAESPYALLMLSSIYGDGIYVEKNPEKSTEYSNKAYACKDTKKLADDLCNLAMDMVYSRHSNVVQDSDKILSMLKTSSDLGSGRAGNELMQMYIYYLKPQDNRYIRQIIDFDTVSIDLPIIATLKKYKKENEGKQPEDFSKLPPEITDEFFRLIMKSDKNDHHNLFLELYLAFRDGIGFIEQDSIKVQAIKEKFGDSHYFRNGDSVEENVIYAYIQGGVLIEQDLLKAVEYIEKKNTLSRQDLDMLKSIKRELEQNYKIQEKVRQLLNKSMR